MSYYSETMFPDTLGEFYTWIPGGCHCMDKTYKRTSQTQPQDARSHQIPLRAEEE